MNTTTYSKQTVDISKYQNRLSISSKIRRLAWWLVQNTLFAYSPTAFFGWRRFLLRLFGANVQGNSYVYPTVDIWDPVGLQIGSYTSIGPRAVIYTVDKIIIGSNVTVSMEAMLCTGSHDVTDPAMSLTHKPIRIHDGAWICARSFIGPGVVVGECAVVAACSVVAKDIPSMAIVAGNPATFKKLRVFREET